MWGTIPLLAGEVDLPPVGIVLVRVWVGAIGLGAVLAARRRAGPIGAKNTTVTRRRMALLGPLLAVHWTAMFAGYERAPSGAVVFVVFLAPIGIAVAAPRVLGERPTAPTVAALAVAVVGFALVTGPTAIGDGDAAAGIAWAALSGLTLVVLVLASKPLAAEVGGLELTFVELAGAGLVLSPFAFTVDWGRATGAAWAWLIVLGLLHTAAGVAVYLSVLAKVPATHVGILGYLEPVAVVVLAWAVAGDAPSVATVVGGALIVCAGAFVVLTQDGVTRVPGSEVPAHVPG
jgi:drug/metabolite transporter (DMT)-like permease